MNGLAASRRSRGLPGMALNIGVIYGLGFLHREKDELYAGLEREGYPPISERDVHHMFLEAIVAGRPPKPTITIPGTTTAKQNQSQIVDITTGLSRFRFDGPNPLHWHLDPRFSHFTIPSGTSDESGDDQGAFRKQSVKEILDQAETAEAATEVLLGAFTTHLEGLLQLPPVAVHGENSISELGVDSLVAVDIRSWFWRSTETDVAVMKILASVSINKRKPLNPHTSPLPVPSWLTLCSHIRHSRVRHLIAESTGTRGPRNRYHRRRHHPRDRSRLDTATRSATHRHRRALG